jgi:formylglycine-generating enzyme
VRPLSGLCALLLGLLAGCPDNPYQKPVEVGQSGPKKSRDESPGKRPAGAVTEPKSDMVLFPGGSFPLGSMDFEDEKSGQIILLSAFSLDRKEVTNGEYRLFLLDLKKRGVPTYYPKEVLKAYPAGKDHTPKHWGTDRYKAVSPGDRYPVVWVDWYDALAYAAWAGKRLPRECEWERAAGWNEKTRRKRLYPWGDRAPGAKGVFLANYKPALGAGLDGFKGLSSAESFLQGASPQGLLNMGGNVAEWCHDWYRPSYKDQSTRDPQGPSYGVDKVVRGGGYLSSEDSLRSTHRLFVEPETRQPFLGFRCAK